ncbi:MAG: LysR substrate-binding domain-containing protein [Candidatus Korobacteraceae bacterium]|jgi:LysR family hca operon transcriptional activator
MELRLFRYFVAVAEELNFTRAAERLHTAQPSLSKQIRQLEDIVGTPLFYRHKSEHRMELTEAGRVLLLEAHRVLYDTEHAITMARHAGRRINIGLIPGPSELIFRLVAPILLKQFGDIQIDVRTLSSINQILALKSRELNVGFLHGPVNDDELNTEAVLRTKVVVGVPANHPLARLERIPAKLLAELPAIQFSRTFAPALNDAMQETARRAGVSFRTLFEADSLMTGLNAVASGLGFCILSGYVQHLLPDHVVARPLDSDFIPELEVLAAYRKDDTLPALAILLNLLRQSGPLLDPPAQYE